MDDDVWRYLPVGLAGLLLVAVPAPAQVPPAAVSQFEHTIGNRVEAVTILGGDYAAAGGIYTFRGGNLADLSVGKIGGGGAIAAPRPLGVGEIQWAPLLQLNAGHINAENEFRTGYLKGNRTVYDALAAQFGAGARFYFTEHLSFAPVFSGIYGHTENEFKPRNAVGDFIKQAARGTYVDWDLDTWSIVPEVSGRYGWHWGRTTFELDSRYNFYHTESFDSSSPVVGVTGDSSTWRNKLDVDAPLGWKVFGRELRTGGFFARTELFGNIAPGLNEEHVYTINGRFVLDLLGVAWKVRWMGAGVSYFWAEHFSGWSAGLDLKLQF